MDQSARLVKILCPGDVCWKYTVAAPSFIDTVDLDRQQNRNPLAIQLTGELVDGGSAPAVPEQNDARMLAFLRPRGDRLHLSQASGGGNVP